MGAPVFAFSAALVLFLHHMIRTTVPRGEEHVAWPRNRTRDTKVYVHPDKSTTIHAPKNICSGPKPLEKRLPLLIIVNSAPSHYEVRRIIRQSWGDTSNYKPLKSYIQLLTQNKRIDEPKNGNQTLTSDIVKVIFIIGLSPNDKIQEIIEKEIEKYGDILQENFKESYYDLSIKSVLMLKWLNNNCNESVNYVFKTDDDIYVDVERILVNLVYRPKTAELTKMAEMHGYLNCNSKAHRWGSRWYCPKYLCPNSTYPCYFSGLGYFLTLPAVSALYKAALITPLFPYEDVYITGYCRENVRPHITVTADYNYIFKVEGDEKRPDDMPTARARQTWMMSELFEMARDDYTNPNLKI